MRSNGVVRVVHPDDATELQATCLPMASVDDVRRDIDENVAGLARGQCVQLVAEADGRVAGMVIIVREPHSLRQHRGSLFSLVVGATYQRRGIARQLIDQARQHARRMGIEILEISCRGATPAEHVYRRLGFEELGRLPNGLKEPWGDHHTFDEVSFYMPV